jgi:hypothetical protein
VSSHTFLAEFTKAQVSAFVPRQTRCGNIPESCRPTVSQHNLVAIRKTKELVKVTLNPGD